MKKTTLALMLIAVLALTGCSQAEQEEVVEILTEEEPMEETEEAETIEVEAEAEPDTAAAESEVELAYAEAEYTRDKAALSEAGPKVLYFHAEWCRTCRALEKRVEASIGDFPEGTTIVQLDYDTEKELKAKYGVKVQTSLVVLDAAGNQVGNVLVNPSNDQLIQAINQTL